MKFLILFTVCTIANVTINTIRSLMTIKGDKWSAAFWNAICYGFYTYIIVLTAGDGLSTIVKMIITAIANFGCVFLIKYIEEKRRKIKLWKVELTVPKANKDDLHNDLKSANLSHYFIETHKWSVFNVFCETERDSEEAKKIANKYNAKYFVSETKEL